MAHARNTADADITAINTVMPVEENVDHKTTGIGANAVALEPAVISHMTVGHTKYVPIQSTIAGLQRMETRRTQYGVIRCWC